MNDQLNRHETMAERQDIAIFQLYEAETGRERGVALYLGATQLIYANDHDEGSYDITSVAWQIASSKGISEVTRRLVHIPFGVSDRRKDVHDYLINKVIGLEYAPSEVSCQNGNVKKFKFGVTIELESPTPADLIVMRDAIQTAVNELRSSGQLPANSLPAKVKIAPAEGKHVRHQNHCHPAYSKQGYSQEPLN